MLIAKKTLAAIEANIVADQGASYRGYLEQVIPHMGDAYSTSTFPFRPHMGSSGLGNKCARAIWYGFRWVTKTTFGGRQLRLFNRGHLEEARFIAMLLAIGVQVYQQDENGNQFRISDADGHLGGSGDGIGVGVPDVAVGMRLLLEFKTANNKKFVKVAKNGCKIETPVYHVQQQIYMHKMGLAASLFMMVNKDNDEIHAEIINYDRKVAEEYLNRGVKIVYMRKAPERISEKSSWFECKWCDHRKVCHMQHPPLPTCRSCAHGMVGKDKEWLCAKFGTAMDKDMQLAECPEYKRLF